MRALIFTEGGSQIGLGHISRCSSLYDELESKDLQAEFLIHGDLKDIEIIKNKKYKVINWLSVDFLHEYIKENDYCIVDSYLASDDLYQVISDRAKKCLFIDDNGRINYPKGIVVNPSLSAYSVKYPLNDKTCYLLGPEYIILRKPFLEAKRDSINSHVTEVLITMGGSDSHNVTEKVLKYFSERYKNIKFNVILGNSFKNIQDIKSINFKNINFYENITAEEMKNIMLRSDFAITAAGQTIYELLATRTPFVLIKTAENQNNNISGLIEFNFVDTVLDCNETDFFQKLEIEFKKFLYVEKRMEKFNLYYDVIDGLGSKRLTTKLVASHEVG